MAKFIIDANLPYYFSLWNSSDFIHLKDLDETWSDDVIWSYAKENGLTIITKDADFSSKILLKGAPPKVIHIRVGNLRIKDLYAHLNKNWTYIAALIEENNLINVYSNRIEIIK